MAAELDFLVRPVNKFKIGAVPRYARRLPGARLPALGSREDVLADGYTSFGVTTPKEV